MKLTSARREVEWLAVWRFPCAVFTTQIEWWYGPDKHETRKTWWDAVAAMMPFPTNSGTVGWRCRINAGETWNVSFGCVLIRSLKYHFYSVGTETEFSEELETYSKLIICFYQIMSYLPNILIILPFAYRSICIIYIMWNLTPQCLYCPSNCICWNCYAILHYVIHFYIVY